MFAFYYHDSVFAEKVDESTAKALNALSASIVDGIRTEVLFYPESTFVTYTVKMPALLDDANNSQFRAGEVRNVLNALRVLFKPASEGWTHHKVIDKEHGADKCRSRVFNLGKGGGDKVVYINLYY